MIKESACNAGDLHSILGWEDSLEKGMATHCSILVWRIPQAMEPSGLESTGSQRVGHDWLSLHPTTPGRSRDSKMGKMIPALQQLHSHVFWNQRIYSLNISFLICKTGSVQFSCLAMSDSLQPHGLQRAMPLCPSLTPGVYPNSSPSSQWRHPTISSSVTPFFCLQSYPASESVLPIRWLKYWNFSFNISPSNEYSGPISFRMDWLDLLAVQVSLKSLLQHHSA